MKKFLMAAIALTAILASCNEAKVAPENPSHILTKTIKGNIQEIPTAVTKTELDAIDYYQIWNEGDEISVVDGSTNTKFTLVGKGGSAYGEFAGSADVDLVHILYAVYPYSDGNSAQTGGNITLTYPDRISYNHETCCAMGDNVMIGCNFTNNVFKFKNACAFLKISLTGNATITSMVLSGKDNEDIAGTAKIRLVGENSDIMISQIEGSKTITIDLGENGVTLTGEPLEFVIGIAPVFVSGIVCTYTTSDGDTVVNTYDFVPEFNTVSLLPVEKFKTPTVYLNGADMNAAIKTLAGGSTGSTSTVNNTVTGISFETGVDLSTIQGGIDISEPGDGRILLTYSDGTATVSTDGEKIATNMEQMFRNFAALTTISGLDKVNASRTTSLNLAFSGCAALTSLDLSTFDFAGVTTASRTFENMTALTTLDVSAFEGAQLVSTASMFAGCGASEITGFSSFDTSCCEDMSSMFSGCAVTALDLSGLDTSKDTTMANMFRNTASLASLTLGNSFNTENVADMSYMFSGTALTTVDLSGFKTPKLRNFNYMFSGANSMTEIDLSSFTTESNPVFNNCFQFAATNAITKIVLGNGIKSLGSTLQQSLFPTYSTSLTSFDLICSVEFAQALLTGCSGRNLNSVNLIKNGKMVARNLNDNPFTYCNGTTPIEVSAVSRTSTVVDPDAE